MNSRTPYAALTLIICLTITACVTSPLGRSQLALFPESEMNQMGTLAYQDIRKETPIDNDKGVNNYVLCVSNAIVSQANPEIRAEDWQVTVFNEDQANAFALPGGKIGVYTGLLSVATNQDQLATVIGHEIAHVEAHHANERVSTSYLAQSGTQLVAALATGTPETQNDLMALLGVGAQVGVLLPFGRTQESEADLLGLDLMADAGFDPRESVQLWRNMDAKGGQQPPEFLSTHPGHDTRIAKLQERMGRAMGLYEQAQAAGRRPNCQR